LFTPQCSEPTSFAHWQVDLESHHGAFSQPWDTGPLRPARYTSNGSVAELPPLSLVVIDDVRLSSPPPNPVPPPPPAQPPPAKPAWSRPPPARLPPARLPPAQLPPARLPPALLPPAPVPPPPLGLPPCDACVRRWLLLILVVALFLANVVRARVVTRGDASLSRVRELRASGTAPPRLGLTGRVWRAGGALYGAAERVRWWHVSHDDKS